MKMQEISKKYLDTKNWYVNINKLVDYINELYDYNFIISVVDFLKVNEKWTQPFMEYSLWEKNGYSKWKIINDLNKLKIKLINENIKEDEMYFDVLVKNNYDKI